MACSCGCSPCCCTTATEAEGSECSDPGLLPVAAFAGVFGEDMCPKRLASYRGEDEAGDPDTNTTHALKHGIQVQTADGEVKWTAAPCNGPPKKLVRVENTTQAADAGNYIPFTTGKTAEDCDRRIVGPVESESETFKYIWSVAMQAFTLVPDNSDDATALCTTLLSGVVLDPANTTGYLIQVESSASMAVGVSLKIAGYEMIVTEIISEIYVRVESAFTITNPTTLEIGESVCNIGFRPCPRTEEPYADEMVACFNGVPVAIETPADVNDMAVPGIHWRNQLGTWAFVAAPVDPVTGILSSNYYFATPSGPVTGGANIPGFRSLPKYNPISQVTLFTQLTGGLPVDATTTVTLSGTAGFIPGATVAWISIDSLGLTGTASYHAYIKINGEVRSHIAIGIDAKGGAQFNGPFPVPLDGSTEVDIEVDLVLIAAGTSTQYSCNVYVNGYTA